MRNTHADARGVSLWSIIEGLQRRLEGEGLNAEVVDAAVTRGIAEILGTAPLLGGELAEA
jgi:hypothetical protein